MKKKKTFSNKKNEKMGVNSNRLLTLLKKVPFIKRYWRRSKCFLPHLFFRRKAWFLLVRFLEQSYADAENLVTAEKQIYQRNK
jgi:hypothetical protein